MNLMLQANKLSSDCKEDAVLANQFVPLFGKQSLTLEMKIGTTLANQCKGIQKQHIGIGNRWTLHGTPDLRISGVPVTVTTNRLSGIQSANSDGSPNQDESTFAISANGSANPNESANQDESTVSANESANPNGSANQDESTVDVDAKIVIKGKSVDQVAATCIISSFMQKNLYPNKNPMVPAILINKSKFIIFLFDCVVLCVFRILHFRPHSKLYRRTIAKWNVLSMIMF